MVCPQHRNFSCHDSDQFYDVLKLWILNFRKCETKGLKKPFGDMPRNPKKTYFSHGFLRVFYGFLRVFYGLGKHDVFEFHYGFLRVFYGLRRVFYGVPGFSSLGALIFPKNPNKFNVALWKDDSWIIGFYRFLCWAASMWLQNRIGNHRLIGMFEELVYLFIAPIQNYVQCVYTQLQVPVKSSYLSKKNMFYVPKISKTLCFSQKHRVFSQPYVLRESIIS